MNIPIWIVLIAPPVFAMIGFFACAVLTAGKVADSEYASDCLDDAFVAASKSHTRVTDALAAKNARIEQALEQVTPAANATVKRMAAILRGER